MTKTPGVPLRRDGARGMIVCSCSRISDRDILEAIGWMRAADPHRR